MNWFKRLTGGLNKTASGIKKSIGSIFKGNKLDVSKLESLEAVSYTHLTLPTILLV